MLTKRRKAHTIRACEEKYPKLWRSIYPKRIVPPAGYCNPKWYATSQYGASMLWLDDEMKMLPHTTVTMMTTLLQKYSMPYYFVAPEFAESVLQTEPPEGFRFSDIQWPLDAMTFVLPNSFVRRHFKYYFPFISACRAKEGHYPRLAGLKDTEIPWTFLPQMLNQGEKILFHYPLYNSHGTAVDYTGLYPASLFVNEVATAPYTDATKFEEIMSPDLDWTMTRARDLTPEEEREASTKIVTFTINLLLALTASPEYIKNGSICRPEQFKRGRKVRDELWGPNVIGADYKIRRKSSGTGDGTHASPRMHWRRGHMTHLAFGPRDKFISIDTLPRTPEGKVDWLNVSKETLDAFWACHKLQKVEPILID